MKPLKEFTIKRSEWGTPEKIAGHRSALSQKIDGNIYRCCLGFACKEMGFTDDEMDGVSMPEEINSNSEDINMFTKTNENGYFNTYLAELLATINDNTCIANEHREQEIIKKFAQVGVVVNFID